MHSAARPPHLDGSQVLNKLFSAGDPKEDRADTFGAEAPGLREKKTREMGEKASGLPLVVDGRTETYKASNLTRQLGRRWRRSKKLAN